MITWTSRTGRGRRDVDPFSALEVQVALASDVSTNDADCSQPICQGLMTTLKNSPLVDSVRFESQQEAYTRYKQLFAGQSLADVVRPQSLPATLRVKLNDQVAGAAACPGCGSASAACSRTSGCCRTSRWGRTSRSPSR